MTALFQMVVVWGVKFQQDGKKDFGLVLSISCDSL